MLHSSDLFLGNVDNELDPELSFAFSLPFRMGYVVVFQDSFVFLRRSPLVASCHFYINPLKIEHILYIIMFLGRIKCTKMIWWKKEI